MKFLHPVFMLLLLSFLYRIYRTGNKILGINPKSPEAEHRGEVVSQHYTTARLITALMVPGFIGGIIGVVYFLGINEIFVKTYGHGFLGAGVLGLMISNIFVGKAIKNPAKPSARANILSFHRGLMYFTLMASAGAVATGAMVLISGPST